MKRNLAFRVATLVLPSATHAIAGPPPVWLSPPSGESLEVAGRRFVPRRLHARRRAPTDGANGPIGFVGVASG